VLTVIALTAADERGHDGAIAFSDLLHGGASLNHLAHEFVPDHVACAHRRNVAVDEVQIRAARRGRRDLQDRVVDRSLLVWNGDRYVALPGTMPGGVVERPALRSARRAWTSEVQPM
jgi:hypothetical protein